MTQEDKELLIKDISARLPYGLKAKTKSTSYYDGIDILIDTIIARNGKVYYTVLDNNLSPIFNTSIDNVILYLRPMSSMTEKEKDKYDRLVMCNASWVNDDWLNENHFDYRGLIPMGLALEAPEDMYKTEYLKRRLQEKDRNYQDEERMSSKEEARDRVEWLSEMERDRRNGAGTD